MLKLYTYINLFKGGGAYLDNFIALLSEASNVKITEEINGDRTLDFDYPYWLDKAANIKENYHVECEGQIYRIMKISREKNGNEIMHVSCLHIFYAKAKSSHVQSFGGTRDTIGANPKDVMTIAVMTASGLTVFDEDELSDMGMTSIGSDGFLMDFEAVDKTTTYDVIQQIITNCGRGELYTDNYSCALVDRIGKDNGVRLDISHNMQNVTIERDITNMITRLYPYGKDDAHIGSVNNGKQYIDSDNVEYRPEEGHMGYGIKEGYKDYSDYTDASDIFEHAKWEFDPDNEDRIDVPDINITGSIIDLSKLADGEMYEIGLGDTVRVIDGKNEITERIIKIERYPYEPLETTVSIGRVKKDLFFYLQQMGLMAKRYSRNSTTNGKVSAQAIAGTVVASSTSTTSKSSTMTATISDAMLTFKRGNTLKCRIGDDGSKFVFDVYDNTSKQAIKIGTSGLEIKAYSVKADSVQIGNCTLTADVSGNLYVNGKKILTEE